MSDSGGMKIEQKSYVIGTITTRPHFPYQFSRSHIYLHLPCVPCAIRSTYPPTILLAIPPRVIDPVKTESGWPFSHIAEKCRKGMSPLFTDRNTPTAIILVGNIFPVVAPMEHCIPRRVSRGCGHMMIYLHSLTPKEKRPCEL